MNNGIYKRTFADVLGWNPSSVKFFICSVEFFFLCYYGESLEGLILTRVCIIQQRRYNTHEDKQTKFAFSLLNTGYTFHKHVSHNFPFNVIFLLQALIYSDNLVYFCIFLFRMSSDGCCIEFERSTCHTNTYFSFSWPLYKRQ